MPRHFSHAFVALSGSDLAQANAVNIMLGDVAVMANAKDDRCTVSLSEDKVKQGYKLTFFEDGGKCAKAFPVMAKVVAWRVYKDGTMSFADSAGADHPHRRQQGRAVRLRQLLADGRHRAVRAVQRNLLSSRRQQIGRDLESRVHSV